MGLSSQSCLLFVLRRDLLNCSIFMMMKDLLLIVELRDFEELSVFDLYAVLQLRCEVFIVEQACAYPDVDGKDPKAKHALCLGGNGVLLGALRVVSEGDKSRAFKIGRVVVSEVARGRGVARKLMEAALNWCGETDSSASVELQAQAYLQAFYESCGFEPISDIYPEDGIPHLDMRLKA